MSYNFPPGALRSIEELMPHRGQMVWSASKSRVTEQGVYESVGYSKGHIDKSPGYHYFMVKRSTKDGATHQTQLNAQEFHLVAGAKDDNDTFLFTSFNSALDYYYSNGRSQEQKQPEPPTTTRTVVGPHPPERFGAMPARQHPVKGTGDSMSIEDLKSSTHNLGATRKEDDLLIGVMGLRDQFAIEAMSSMLSVHWALDTVPQQAYKLADAMMKERAK